MNIFITLGLWNDGEERELIEAMSKATKRILIISITIILIALITFTYFSQNRSDLPTVSTSIRVKEIRTDSIAIKWIVGNESERLITFDENNIMQVELNGQEFLYPTQATILEPGEEVCIDLELRSIDTDQINTVKITAKSNEETKASFIHTFYPYQKNIKTTPA